MAIAVADLPAFPADLAALSQPVSQAMASPRAEALGGYTVYIVPHSHIDVEWTWDYPETIRRVNSILGNAFKGLKRDPDYHFSQDQVPCVEPFLDRLTGEDRETFIKLCREGRFEIVGGMYVQPEVAEPHGEALIRQIVYGRKWFETALGVREIPMAWNADTFGQVSQLPQICAKAGFKYFCFSRGVDTLAGGLLPADFQPAGTAGARYRPGVPSDFWWVSPDGTRIQAHWMPVGYPARVNGTQPKQVARQINEIAAHAVTKSLLFPWGQDCYDPENEGSAAILASFRPELFNFPVARIKLSSVREYLESVAAQGNLPQLTHDMAECDLRGTFDNRCRLKQANRRSEQLLLAAEKLATLCSLAGVALPAGELPSLWEKLLFNQFHDIIGGSHIDAVYTKAMARYDEIANGADSLIQAGLQALGSRIDLRDVRRPVLVFNPCSSPATGLCSAEVFFRPDEGVRDVGLRDSAGETLPLEAVEPVEGRDGEWRSAKVQFVARDVPPLGYATYEVVTQQASRQKPLMSRRPDCFWIESPAYKVSVDPATGLASIFDKRRGEIVVNEGNELVADQEIEPNLEGHNIRYSGVSFRSRDLRPDRIEAESGGRVSVLRIIGPYKDCRRIQEIRLYEDLPLVEFSTRLEGFSGGDVMVKARFPVAAGSARTILYETPFAVTSRPEGHYCAQTWAGIEDKSGGVAIINKGTAGYYAADTTLDLVLMRSAADYRGYHAPLANEHGDHVFEYALYSYAGRWEDSELIELAHSYNAPLCAREVVARKGGLPRRGALLETAGSGAEWVAVKEAERGGAIVLRGYETRGRETTVRVKLPPGCKEVWTADLLEQPLAKLDVRGGRVAVKFGKWEIVTLLLLMHPARSGR